MTKRIMAVMALLLTAACWGYRLNDNGYICDWLIRGPYPSYQTEETVVVGGTGFNCDFLAEDQDGLGGERGCLPSLGADGAGFPRKVVFVADEAKLVAGLGATNEWGVRHNIETTVAWKELHYGPSDCYYKLDDGLKPLDDFIVNYLACYIYSPADREILVKGGCDDDHKLYLNGEVIGYANGSCGADPNNFTYKASLKRGLNQMLVKIVDRIADHGVIIGLFNPDGSPVADVEIFTESPADAIVQSGACKYVKAWDMGCYLGMDNNDSLFAGVCKLAVTCGDNSGKTNQVKLSVIQGGKEIAAVSNDGVTGNWKPELEFELPSDDDVTLTAEFRGVESNGIVVLSTTIPVLSSAKIQAQLDALKIKNAELTQKLDISEKNLATANLGGETVKQMLRDEYATMEKIYRESRAALDKKIGAAGLSIDKALPVAPAGLRKSISLDTELWKMAKGEKMDPIVFNPPVDDNAWRQEAMPFRGSNDYFRTFFYPVKLSDPNNPYSKLEALEGWEDFQYNDWLGNNYLWFQKDVELDFDPAGMICEYKCGAIWGRVHLFVNGELCGNWNLPIGVATIPVKGLRKGKNTVTIFFERSNVAGIHEMPYMEIYQGIIGNSTLEFRPNLPDMTVVAKPSWRNAELTVETIFDNSNSSRNNVMRLCQYVTLNGRVVKELPKVEKTCEGGCVCTVETSVPWTDAQCWGIGDAAGSPVLYTLVSDLVDENGNIVDRKTNTFGFREVWSAGHFIYMNGHRIVIQGEVGYECHWERLTVPKEMELHFSALRDNGVNCIRNHDSCYWSEEFLNTSDRIGSYVYANMYPWLWFPGHKDSKFEKIYKFEEWMETDFHKENLLRYKNWVKMVENHPSVVILSTDNEVATQAWDTQDTLFRNQENEKIAAWYNNYVKELTEGRYVMTRDGDVGTWNWDGKWADDPACETANFHYPNYEVESRIFNWPLNFKGNRPLVYGENLYCAYFKNGWKTPDKETMLKRATEVRKQAKFVREWEVPVCIWMGQGADGFVYFDEKGSGSPYGITLDMYEGREKPCYKGWPYIRITWPAMSGPGPRQTYAEQSARTGWLNFNWSDPNVPTHVVTPVNDAYRETMLPQPKIAADTRAECVIRLADGRADVPITARRVDGEASHEFVTLTDSQGRAYFIFGEAGKYEFRCGDKKLEADLVPMGEYITKSPGFIGMSIFNL